MNNHYTESEKQLIEEVNAKLDNNAVRMRIYAKWFSNSRRIKDAAKDAIKAIKKEDYRQAARIINWITEEQDFAERFILKLENRADDQSIFEIKKG